MFDCLADFIKAAGKEDKKFIVFPYNLSNYKSMSALPPGVHPPCIPPSILVIIWPGHKTSKLPSSMLK